MEGDLFADKKENAQEKEPGIVAISPAVESLINIQDQNSPWPIDIKNNEKLAREIELRKKSIADLDLIFQSLPESDTEIRQAVESGTISPDNTAKTYQDLTQLLESDEYNSRLILYFPFELIPEASWESQSDELKNSMMDFMQIYMKRWNELLGVSDVRANFVDGDVFESELREKPLERVVKAAHLIPKLLEKGHLNISEISKLIEENPGSALEKSLVDTLPVLVDMNLMSQDELDHILEINSINIEERAVNIASPDQVTPARIKWLDEMREEGGTQDLKVPFDADFTEKEKVLRNDIDLIKETMESIGSSELGKFIYPVSILFGSRIKGYGKEDADLDVAVFVKPGVNIKERSRIKELLSKDFSDDKIKGKVVEFWLEDSEGGLEITNFAEPDSTLGDNTWAHVLFEGAWIGETDSIKDLYDRLLSNYLYSKDKTINGADARTIWLEEMEKDTLQYRLMHKGYKRFFSRQGGIDTEHSDQIDGESTFYDSGYRRLATKLFLSRVFLPQLERS